MELYPTQSMLRTRVTANLYDIHSTSGVDNYFCPLCGYSCLAGTIKAKKAILMLQKLVFAGRMLPASRMLSLYASKIIVNLMAKYCTVCRMLMKLTQRGKPKGWPTGFANCNSVIFLKALHRKWSDPKSGPLECYHCDYAIIVTIYSISSDKVTRKPG
jgi:hypothetical protein